MCGCRSDSPVCGTIPVDRRRRPGLYHTYPGSDAGRRDDGDEQLVAPAGSVDSRRRAAVRPSRSGDLSLAASALARWFSSVPPFFPRRTDGPRAEEPPRPAGDCDTDVFIEVGAWMSWLSVRGAVYFLSLVIISYDPSVL